MKRTARKFWGRRVGCMIEVNAVRITAKPKVLKKRKWRLQRTRNVHLFGVNWRPLLIDQKSRVIVQGG